ncbi:MAG: hypothetical protein AAGF47_04995 [Planctomycetota bacterium]
MTSIDTRDMDQLCERIRYRARFNECKTLRADRALAELGATDPTTAVRRSQVGIADSPVLTYLKLRGVVRETGSGRIWLNEKRRDRLASGMAVRLVGYVAFASLFSGAAMAMASAGI